MITPALSLRSNPFFLPAQLPSSVWPRSFLLLAPLLDSSPYCVWVLISAAAPAPSCPVQQRVSSSSLILCAPMNSRIVIPSAGDANTQSAMEKNGNIMIGAGVVGRQAQQADRHEIAIVCVLQSRAAFD